MYVNSNIEAILSSLIIIANENNDTPRHKSPTINKFLLPIGFIILPIYGHITTIVRLYRAKLYPI
jgi:hypothetical protein